MQEETLPFGRELTVAVGDSSYSKAAYLHSQRQFPPLVSLVRVQGNRVFYQLPEPRLADEASPGRGHPTWYGAPFALADPASWSLPHETLTWWESSRRGTRYRVEIQTWTNLLMRGKQQPDLLPMHQHPFTLIRVMHYDQTGKALCKRPLWLIVMGQQRAALTLRHIYQAYTARFDIEHFFRFGKQKLQLVNFQTPQVEREETWWHLVHIAYAQLWMARHLAQRLPRPWERNLPVIQARQTSPTLVQRDFARLIRQFGTPAQPPKPRGISPGRRKGTILPKRPRHKVVVKHRRPVKAA
ncbi:MAG: transposase [Ardenticatenales bacterium]|nr:transposase [Ardenticatenales bacterium]